MVNVHHDRFFAIRPACAGEEKYPRILDFREHGFE
jgi:hypothetical protein